MSRKTQNNTSIYAKLRHAKELLDEVFDSVSLRKSYNNVPHIVVTTKSVRFSVCYMKTSNIYRVFYPYPSGNQEQTKKSFQSAHKVVEYICKITNSK